MSLLNKKLYISLFIILIIVAVGVIVPTTKTSPSANAETITVTTLFDYQYAKIAHQQAIKRQEDIKKWNEAVWIHKTNERLFYEKLAEIEAEKQRQAAIAAQEAKERQEAQIAAQRSQQQRSVQANTQSSGRCGGNLPPCCVMQRESGGSLTAQNPSSSASGKWQFINSTWNGYGGYAEAWMAPESVQDAKAAELWANGAGASHWGGGC